MHRRMLLQTNGKIPIDYILRYDFNGDYLDRSSNSLNGVKTGTAVFDVGRKAGTQSLYFTSGCVRTPSNLPIGTDKVSISFWVKYTVLGTQVMMELSSNSTSTLETFGIVKGPDNLEFRDRSAAGTNYMITGNSKFANWTHVVFTINRSLGINQSFIYINGILDTTAIRAGEASGSAVDLNGNFGNFVFYIGQRNASSVSFNGYLQDLKIYNRVLTTAEIKALSKE